MNHFFYMKKLLPLLVASGMTALFAGYGTEAVSKGIPKDVNPFETKDLISCGGGGGGGNSAKKRAQKKALQEELKKMIEEQKENESE